MKIQGMPQIQLTSENLGKVFRKNGRDSVYVESPCIIAENQTIVQHEIYLLTGIQLIGRSSSMALVKILAIYEDDSLNILLVDLITKQKYNIILIPNDKELDCNATLIDIDFFNKNFIKWMDQI